MRGETLLDAEIGALRGFSATGSARGSGRSGALSAPTSFLGQFRGGNGVNPGFSGRTRAVGILCLTGWKWDKNSRSKRLLEDLHHRRDFRSAYLPSGDWVAQTRLGKLLAIIDRLKAARSVSLS